MAKMRDIIGDSIYRLITQISVPASLGLFFLTIYNLIDTYFAGKINPEALAGLALVFPLFQMISAISNGTTSGIGAVFGNAIGSNNKKYATQVVYNGFLISVILSIIVMIIGLLISPFIISLLTSTQQTQTYALHFIDIMFIGTLTFVVPGFLNALLVAVGNSTTYRNILFGGAFANLILDFLFVSVFNFGVVGIALATIIIQLLQTIYLFFVVKRTEFFKSINFFNAKYFSTKVCLELLKNSLTPAFNMLLFSFGILIYNYYIGLTGGDDALAGFGIAYKIEQILIIPASGIGVAALSIMAQNNGFKKYDRVLETFKKSIYISIVILLAGEVILFLLRNPLLGLFTDDPAVINYGLQYILVELFVIPFYAILSIATSALQALEKPTIVFISTLLRQIILPVLIFIPLLRFYELSTLGVYIIVGVINVIILTSMFIISYSIIKRNMFKMN